MSRRRYNRPRPDSLATSYETNLEEEEEEEEEETCNGEESGEFQVGKSLLFPTSRAHHSMIGDGRQRGNTAVTPVSPGGLLGDV